MSSQQARSYFVVGTDTGVGKTVVTALLTLHFKAKGLNVGVMKPFASGCSEPGTIASEEDDGPWLKQATASPDELTLINPVRWGEALTPLTAAQRAGDERDYWQIAKDKLVELQARHECMIVEGVGGLFAPIAERDGRILNNADWATELDLPVIIVARRNLGTINHTLLTIEALRARNIEIAGLVFCDVVKVDEADIAVQTGPELISKSSQINVVGKVPYFGDLSPAALQIAANKLKL